MRVVGIDLGSKRIGVAVSDASGTIATPLTADHAAIAAIVSEYEAVFVVVGLPLTLAGDVGPAAKAAIDEAGAIARVVGVPVETFDERLTTVAADAILMERRMRAEARRRLVDKVAAAVMLQSWLDARDPA
jgi:putative Holliday junction resolvase